MKGAMQPSFSITVDTSLSLVRVTLAGFFRPADVERFHMARREAHQLLTCQPHEHQTIVDIRDMEIQPQKSVSAFQAILADPSYQGRQIAVVVPLSLARSQIKRAAAERTAAYFETVEQAEAWLEHIDRSAAA